MYMCIFACMCVNIRINRKNMLVYINVHSFTIML